MAKKTTTGTSSPSSAYTPITVTTPATDTPASAEAAPSPGATTLVTAAPTAPAAPEAPTGKNRTGSESGASVTPADEKKSASIQIVTRFPAELAARLDRFTDSLRSDRFGLRVSRADAVRILVNEGLGHFEKEHTAAATARPS